MRWAHGYGAAALVCALCAPAWVAAQVLADTLWSGPSAFCVQEYDAQQHLMQATYQHRVPDARREAVLRWRQERPEEPAEALYITDSVLYYDAGQDWPRSKVLYNDHGLPFLQVTMQRDSAGALVGETREVTFLKSDSPHLYGEDFLVKVMDRPLFVEGRIGVDAATSLALCAYSPDTLWLTLRPTDASIRLGETRWCLPPGRTVEVPLSLHLSGPAIQTALHLRFEKGADSLALRLPVIGEGSHLSDGDFTLPVLARRRRALDLPPGPLLFRNDSPAKLLSIYKGRRRGKFAKRPANRLATVPVAGRQTTLRMQDYAPGYYWLQLMDLGTGTYRCLRVRKG